MRVAVITTLATLWATAGCDRNDEASAPEPRSREAVPAAVPGAELLAGFELGGSHDSMRQLCEGAGHRFNDPADLEAEHPQVHQWVESGRMARCSGAPEGSPWGEVVGAYLTFLQGRLVALTCYVDGDPQAARAGLLQRYPRSMPGPSGRVIYVINEDAASYEPKSGSISPPDPGVAGSRFAVTVMTPVGMGSPLPGVEGLAPGYLLQEQAEGRTIAP